jgi:transcription-repair coupling factor (superfamily II helicase)
VELPLPISIPAEYIPDKSVRLSLYRRLADIRQIPDLEALIEEFQDRFGALPQTVQNLFFQLRVKLLADRAGLASVTAESGQIALRFADGSLPENLPDMGPGVRVGKTAIWLPYLASSEWPELLVEVLRRLGGRENA